MPGALGLLTAKLAGLGTVAKAAIAAITAALTMTVAGGATGVLPVPGSHTATAVVPQAAVDQAAAALQAAAAAASAAANTAANAAASTPQVQASVHTSAPSTTASTAAATSPKTSVTSNVNAANTAASAGAVTNAATLTTSVTSSTLPLLSKLPSCVAALIPAPGTTPDLAKLFSQLPACILSVVKAHLPLDTVQPAIGSAHLPVDLFKCLVTALKAAPVTAGGTNLSGLRQALAGCLPAGSLPGTATGSASVPGLGSFTGLKSGR
jgi:hypothetical protein